MQCSIMVWLLEEKKDVSGKTSEIQIKYSSYLKCTNVIFLILTTIIQQRSYIRGNLVKSTWEFSVVYSNFFYKPKFIPKFFYLFLKTEIN
jgi:hypothetical protein